MYKRPGCDESDPELAEIISSDDDFDNNVNEKNNLEKIDSSESSVSSALDDLSSAEELQEMSLGSWYTISTKCSTDVMVEIMSSQYYQSRRKHDMKNINVKRKEDEDDIRRVIKEIILDAILQYTTPHFFIPCSPMEQRGIFSFDVFDCKLALKKLEEIDNECTSQVIPNLKFKFRIQPKDDNRNTSSNINVPYLIHLTLKKRLEDDNEKLNLSNFPHEPTIKDVIYFPLWYPANQKILAMRIKKMSSLKIKVLDLSKNSIRCFAGFNPQVTFDSIKTLDLSRNAIGDLKQLVPFHGMTVKDIKLEYNRLCLNYITKEEYLIAVKLIFPVVKIVDGNDIYNPIPKTVKNFSCDKDAVPIVGKFMEVFYNLFDSEERSSLMNIYAKDAVLSICCHSTDSFILYKKARNILEYNTANIFCGPRSIIGCLCWIPSTVHDPTSFFVDVLHYSKTMLIINIKGLFKLSCEFSMHNAPIYEFVRTFVLRYEENERQYTIANDLFYVHILSNTPASRFQLKTRSPSGISLTPTAPLLEPTKKCLTDFLITLTKLTKAEAELCLNSNQWNFQLAVKQAMGIVKHKY